MIVSIRKFFKKFITLLPNLALFFCLFFSAVALANPVLDGVTSGDAAVSQSGNTTTINQNSQQAIIQWNSFNIAAHEKTQFIQPNASAVALNRIDASQGASQIYGQLTSNGKIILINGAGIHFGPNSLVNVGSLIASTSDITNANFLAGKYIFDIPSLYSGSIVNEGKINAANYGLVALLGDTVNNSGSIRARLGSIAIGSGSEFTLDFNGDQLINFSVSAPASSKSKYVTNSGKLLADGGQILVSAEAAAGVLNNVINMHGVAITRSVTQRNGEIILSGSDNTAIYKTKTGSIVLSGGDNGTVEVSGTLIASSKHGSGGSISVTGSNVHLTSTAKVDVSGYAGGGDVSIGGNARGNGPLPNALSTTIDSGSIINASALNSGNGGNIVIWSDDHTQVAGTLLAQGGLGAGDGGNVETSGGYLDVTGLNINLLAAHGKTGNWLLDPTNVVIDNVTTSNDAYANGTYTPAATVTSYISASDLINYLASTNISILTSSSGTGLGDITVNTALTWSSANTLTLTAANNIYLNGAITATNGGLTLSAANTALTNTITSGSESAASVSGVTAGISVKNFTLSQGEWYQNSSSLPRFSVSNSFTITTGTAFNSTFAGQFTRVTGGTGAASTPYAIADVYGLQGAASLPLASNYNLANNVDATVTSNWLIGGGTGFYNIPGTYSGVFNGQGNTISNLTLNTKDYGMFNIISGTVENLGLVNATLHPAGTANASGLLASQSTGTLLNDYSTGNVSGAQPGGLLGYLNGGTATNIYSNAIVTSTGDAGGLIGAVNAGTLNGGYSTGTVTSTGTGNSIGGLVGFFSGGTITNSYATGNVTDTTSNGSNVGGLVGTSYATLTNSYAANNVVAGSNKHGSAVGSLGARSVTNGVYYNSTLDSASFYGGYSGTSIANYSGLTSAQMAVSSNFPTFTFTGTTPTWSYNSSGYSFPVLTALASSALNFFVTGTITNGSTYANNGIALYVNGAAIASSTVSSSGTFSFNLTPTALPNSTAFLVALTGSTLGGVVDTTLASSSNLNLTFTANAVTVGDASNNSSFSNTSLSSAAGTSTSLLYSASGNNVTLSNNIGLSILSNVSYALNGNITASGTGAIVFNAPVTVSNNPTVTAANGAITFGSTVNGAAGSNLTLSSATGSSISGAIGSGTNNALGTLTVKGGGTGTLANIAGLSNLDISGATETVSADSASNTFVVDTSGTFIIGSSGTNSLGTNSGQITLNSGTLTATSSASLSSANTIVSNTGTNIVNVSTGNTITINGAISGTQGLSKTGAGTVVLGVDNSYSGATAVSAGTLQVNSAGGLGSSTIGVSGATSVLNLNFNNALTDSNTITLTAGTLSLTNGASLTNSIAVSGTAAISNSATSYTVPSSITLASGSSLTISAPSLVVSTAISLPANTTLALTATSGTLSINNSIEGTGNTSVGNLFLSAPNTANTQTIIPNANAIINVNNFTLSQGEWYQNASTLPAFTVGNSFTIATGTTFNSTFAAQFLRVTGGNGSTTPYSLADVYGLQGVATAALTSNFMLANNIDATATANWSIGGGTGFYNIPGNYAGTFDGQSNTISNLTINNKSYGLFNFITGTVKNLGVVNATLHPSSTANPSGLLASQSSGVLTNDYSSGTVSGSQVGGLIGYMSGGTATNIYSMATVTSTGDAGGLLGALTTGTLNGGYSTGSVTSTGTGNSIGGLVGYFNNAGTIINTYTTGNVTDTNSNGSNVGGLVGTSYATIKNSYASNTVTAGSNKHGSAVGSLGANSVTNGVYFNNSLDSAAFYGAYTGTSIANYGGLNSTQMTVASNFVGFTFSGTTPTWAYLTSGYAYPVLTGLSAGPFIGVGTNLSGSIVNGSSYANQNIALYVNGASIATTTVNSSGTFSFTNVASAALPASTAFLIQLTGSAAGGIVDTTLASGTTISSLSLTINTLSVGDSANNSSFSNASLAAAVGSASNLLYTASGNNLTLNSGISLSVLGNVSYALNGNISTSGAGAVTFNSHVTVSNNPTITTVNGGISFASTVNGVSGSNLTLSSGSSSNITGNIGSGTNNALGTLTVKGGGSGSLGTIAGLTQLSVSGATETVNGDTAANTFSVDTNGKLIIGSSATNPLGAISGQVTLNSGTLAAASNAILPANNSVVLSGSGINSIYASTNGTLTINSVISGGGNLNISGPGTVTLGGVNSYTGTTTAANGTLQVNSSVNLSSNTINLAGGTLSLLNGINVSNAISVSGTSGLTSNASFFTLPNMTINSGATLTVSAPNLVIANAITLASGSALSLNATGASGTIAINNSIEGTGNTSLGSLTLSASNTAQSILPNANATINVNNFTLQQGEWYQNSATLPGFFVGNSFSIASIATNTNYKTFNNTFNAEFTRVTGGSGTSASPYSIADVYGLQGVATMPLNSNYILANSINAASTSTWAFGTSTGLYGTPGAYTGIFNGQGNSISNLALNSKSVGLFTAITGTVENLGLVNATLHAAAASTPAGLLASTSSGTLLNDYSTGSISGFVTGGLVGSVSGNGSNLYSTASVNATNDAGGLFGQLVGGTLNQAYSTGNVVSTGGGDSIGGLIGYFNTGTVSNVYTTGNVTDTAGGSNVGGIIGTMYATLNNAYAVNTVTAGGNIHGSAIGSAGASSVINGVYYNSTLDSANFYGSYHGNSQKNYSGLTSTQMAVYTNFVNFNFANSPSVWGYVNGYAYPVLTALTPGSYSPVPAPIVMAPMVPSLIAVNTGALNQTVNSAVISALSSATASSSSVSSAASNSSSSSPAMNVITNNSINQVFSGSALNTATNVSIVLGAGVGNTSNTILNQQNAMDISLLSAIKLKSSCQSVGEESTLISTKTNFCIGY